MPYIGHLSRSDALYGYLRHEILPQLRPPDAAPDFQVYRLRASNQVYLYKDRYSGIRLIGKFFGGVAGRSAETASRRMHAEYNNLVYLRSIGFAGYPHYIARPLGCNAGLNCVLIEEFCEGRLLAGFILDAIRHGARDALFQKLAALASFLATLHNRTADDGRVDFIPECAYFDRVMAQLRDGGRLGWDQAQALYQSKDRWRMRACVWEDRRVLLHGDMTPANVLFGDGPWVIAIDLERMKRADRAFDLGRVVGELKHFFMQHAGDRSAAEPFIGHFLWEYACHFPDRAAAFRSITERIPFYMGLTLLRIARNEWVTDGHRRRLLDEALQTLA